MWLGHGVTRISHVFLFQARGWLRLLLGSFQRPYHVMYHWHLKDGMPWSQPWHPSCRDSRPGNRRAGAWTARLARPYSPLRHYSCPALALQIPPAAPCQLPSQQLAKTLSLQLKLYLWIFLKSFIYIYLVAFNYLDVVCWSSGRRVESTVGLPKIYLRLHQPSIHKHGSSLPQDDVFSKTISDRVLL